LSGVVYGVRCYVLGIIIKLLCTFQLLWSLTPLSAATGRELRSPARKLPAREVGLHDTGDDHEDRNRRVSHDELLFLRQLQQQFQARCSAESDAMLPAPGSAPVRQVDSPPSPLHAHSRTLFLV
jgi:hypothetical protein